MSPGINKALSAAVLRLLRPLVRLLLRNGVSYGAFAELAKSYSGDIPPRAMLDELLRVGTVERGKNGTLRLVTAGYVPKGSSTDQLHILGSDVALLIGTIDHNLTPDQREPYFQRKVAYDNLPVEALAPLRAMTEEKAQALF